MSEFSFHPPLFIVGYMASGKTTFARALARALSRRFVDLDFYIEQRFRTTIAQIFERDGEQRFRTIERNLLHEVGEMSDVVVACGGGTPCFFDNMDYMLSRGTVVYLECSVDRIVQRLTANRHRRPLMASLGEEELDTAVRNGLDARADCYRRAHITFGGEQLENRRQIDTSVARFLPLLVSR